MPLQAKSKINNMIRTLGLVLAVVSLSDAVNLTFFQNEYDVTMDIARVEWFNASIYKYFKADFVLYNRTQRVLNSSWELLLNLKPDVKLDVQVYKMTNNEYRFFPVTVNVNACAEYTKNTFLIKDVLSKTSNIRLCDYKKGSYYINNAMADFSRFPPQLPRGSYKLAATFTYYSYVIVILEFYSKIIDKPVDWKNIPKHG